MHVGAYRAFNVKMTNFATTARVLSAVVSIKSVDVSIVLTIVLD